MLNTDMGSCNCTLPPECCVDCSNRSVYAETTAAYWPYRPVDEKVSDTIEEYFAVKRFNQETDQDDEIQFGGVPV
jgi:hypothetical protein